jgi:hypothetical protein
VRLHISLRENSPQPQDNEQVRLGTGLESLCREPFVLMLEQDGTFLLTTAEGWIKSSIQMGFSDRLRYHTWLVAVPAIFFEQQMIHLYTLLNAASRLLDIPQLCVV